MNLFSKIINPRYPTAAIGLEHGSASAVLIQRQGGLYSLKRAATTRLSEAALKPSFEETNIPNPGELVRALEDLATGAGMLRQKRWSVSLPGATARAVILTMESTPASRNEFEEVLRWKIERSFATPYAELKVTRQRLPQDATGRARFLVIAAYASVIEEYEGIFQTLGWRSGMMLPRHAGEARWLVRHHRHEGDALLLSSHAEGFTAVIMRGAQPLVVRSVLCDQIDRDDELFRLLLYYRDRVVVADGKKTDVESIDRYLLIGDGFSGERVGEFINETLSTNARSLTPDDVGLSLPPGEFTFDAIAAPAGFATLAWE